MKCRHEYITIPEAYEDLGEVCKKCFKERRRKESQKYLHNLKLLTREGLTIWKRFPQALQGSWWVVKEAAYEILSTLLAVIFVISFPILLPIYPILALVLTCIKNRDRKRYIKKLIIGRK